MRMLLVCSVMLLLVPIARAEVVYFKDGQIVKGSFQSEKLPFSTSLGDVQLDLRSIERIEFSSDVIKDTGNTNVRQQFLDEGTRQDYADFMFEKRRQKKKTEARAKSFVSAGYGLGLPYGYVGYCLELLFLGRIGLTTGIDTSSYGLATTGFRYYSGDKGSKFRGRMTVLLGNVGAVTVDSYDGSRDIKISGKTAYMGFQWKVATWMSLDLDIGYAMPDVKSVEYTARRYVYSYSYSNYSYYNNGRYEYYQASKNVSSATVLALGLNFHF